jgi:hypothetical protein
MKKTGTQKSHATFPFTRKTAKQAKRLLLFRMFSEYAFRRYLLGYPSLGYKITAIIAITVIVA